MKVICLSSEPFFLFSIYFLWLNQCIICFDTEPWDLTRMGSNTRSCWNAGNKMLIIYYITHQPFLEVQMLYYFHDFIIPFYVMCQIYIGSFSVGMGAIPWVLMSEVCMYVLINKILILKD